MEGFIRQLLTLPQVQELTAGINGRERHSVVTGLSPVQRAAVAAAAAEQTGREGGMTKSGCDRSVHTC